MALTAINRQAFQFPKSQGEENYFNPIKQHLKKGLNKAKANIEKTPIHNLDKPPNTEKQLRFRDLSKDKTAYYSDLLKQPPSVKENSFKRIIERDQLVQLSNIRRKLIFQSNSTSTSRDKSMSFSDIIRASREKKLREDSRSKISFLVKDNASSTKKQGKVFNALKNRLMGENNPNKANVLSSKPSQKDSMAIPKQTYLKRQKEDLQMVRISNEFDCLQSNTSLDMSPNL